MSHLRRRGLARSLVGALATVAVVATGMAAAGQAQAAPPTKPEATPTPAGKIKPELMAKLDGKDAKEATDYWVRFAAKADLTAASSNCRSSRGRCATQNSAGTRLSSVTISFEGLGRR